MNRIDLTLIRDVDDRFSHRQKQWAWQNGLALEESLRRLLGDPSYCEKFGAFLIRAAQRSQEAAEPLSLSRGHPNPTNGALIVDVLILEASAFRLNVADFQKRARH
jgi:hypothetical protein